MTFAASLSTVRLRRVASPTLSVGSQALTGTVDFFVNARNEYELTRFALSVLSS